MLTEPYLLRLAARLSAGMQRLNAARRDRHRAFIRSRRQADGGFAGREGESDLYYTSFAIRGLMMLGGIDSDDSEALGRYLTSLDPRNLNAVDVLSWLSSAMAVQLNGGPDALAAFPASLPDQLASNLESLRTPDGGYAKSSEGAAGSTYQSFLTALAYELLGRTVPRPKRLIQFLYDRQRDDGGFVEIAPMKHSGTNPTAAASALLQLVGAMDDEIRRDVARYLKQVRSAEGGFQANTRIPFADGLSTFTGMLTAIDLGLNDAFDPPQVRAYATQCLEFSTGGFRGASWDEQADVEYSFYGLGILAVLESSTS